MPYSVQNVIDMASQDVRLQVASTAGTVTATALIDYADRIQKQMLRFSRWHFILSDPQYFMTSYGQTDYWLGPAGSLPPSTVDTGLHLNDLDLIRKDSVRDLSNDRVLKSLGSQPIGPTLNFMSGISRPGLPATFWQDANNSNLLHIYPGPDNANTFQPFPTAPILTSTPNGSLPARQYFVRLTFVDSIGGESQGSTVGTNIYLPVNSVLNVTSPSLYFNKSADGVVYSSYNVYAATTSGSETLQNASPIQLGTNWVEPNTGLITTGVSVPINSTIQQMHGYIIQFRYYRDRITLTEPDQIVQIPDKYIDVLVHGIQALAWKLIGRAEDAQATGALYRSGLTEMIWDKNLFPATDFIRPDAASYVNDQVLGYLPPFF